MQIKNVILSAGAYKITFLRYRWTCISF